MSGRLVGEVFKYAPADLNGSQMLVLVALAEQARDTDRTARYSSAAQLAERTHLAYGTVRNILSSLVARGLIVRGSTRAYRGKAQDYRIAQLHAHHQAATVHHLRPVPEPSSAPTTNHLRSDPWSRTRSTGPSG